MIGLASPATERPASPPGRGALRLPVDALATPLATLADAYHGAIPRAMSRAAAEAVVTEGAA